MRACVRVCVCVKGIASRDKWSLGDAEAQIFASLNCEQTLLSMIECKRSCYLVTHPSVASFTAFLTCKMKYMYHKQQMLLKLGNEATGQSAFKYDTAFSTVGQSIAMIEVNLVPQQLTLHLGWVLAQG